MATSTERQTQGKVKKTFFTLTNAKKQDIEKKYFGAFSKVHSHV